MPQVIQGRQNHNDLSYLRQCLVPILLVPFEVDENRWCRVASLLRHMFDEGLLPSSQVFEELTKMLRLVFGLIQSNQRFNERTQIMVTTEVLSYIDDALSLGFAREFHETCTAILNSSNWQFSRNRLNLLQHFENI